MWGPKPISARRLENRLTTLPLESRTARALGAVAPGQWHNVEELLALLAEELDFGNRLFLMTHSKKGARQPKPLKVPRPRDAGRENRPKPQASTNELKAFFGSGNVVVQYEPKGEVIGS